MIPGGSRRERCKIREGDQKGRGANCLCLHAGQLGAAQHVPSVVFTEGRVHPAQCACWARWGRWRSWSTPSRIGDQLCELSGPSVVPCHTLQGWPFTCGVVARCSGDVPVQCSTWYGACPFLWEQRLSLNASALLFHIYWRISHLIILSLTWYS